MVADSSVWVRVCAERVDNDVKTRHATGKPGRRDEPPNALVSITVRGVIITVITLYGRYVTRYFDPSVARFVCRTSVTFGRWWRGGHAR